MATTRLLANGPERRPVGEHRRSCPHPQGIVDGEERHSDGLDDRKCATVALCNAAEGVEEGDGQIEQQDQTTENVVAAADPVPCRAHFHDGGHPFAPQQPSVFQVLHEEPPGSVFCCDYSR